MTGELRLGMWSSVQINKMILMSLLRREDRVGGCAVLAPHLAFVTQPAEIPKPREPQPI